MKKLFGLFFLLIFFTNCKNQVSDPIESEQSTAQFSWQNATIYFALTDRFYNGNEENDVQFNRNKPTEDFCLFNGGDFKGITKKLKEGYFSDLGVTAIWMTPVVEQIHGGTDEGKGFTYGFHGYWTKDWTAIDPNLGTASELQELVQTAHERGIRILLDAVINHTGPVTEQDPVWPDDWVRTTPQCTYTNFETTVTCTLVENLPDIKTESNDPVELPPQLVQKWKDEGRLQQELDELEAFFSRTGYPRAPRFYIMKWLTDYITDFGIDGYRVDTVKHTESYVWEEFKKECDYSFEQWKKENASKVMDEIPFYLVGEVYNYGVSNGKLFDFGDKKVNYFDQAFASLINFEFKSDANKDFETLFSKYDYVLQNELAGYSTVNYLSSHDDGGPFDIDRIKPFEAATKLLLSPGAAQIYYGDEYARPLKIEGAKHEANLRSSMDWTLINSDSRAKEIMTHYQKLGSFRKNHISIGAGIHKRISKEPYVFERTYTKGNLQDDVVIGLDLNKGEKEISVGGVFKNGEKVKDAYSGIEIEVVDGMVSLNTPYSIVLIEKK